MMWRTEPTRQVYVSGEIIVGAVYPPLRAGLRWRWRCWVNGRHAASTGSVGNQAAARHAVEAVFSGFLKSAGLRPAESEAA